MLDSSVQVVLAPRAVVSAPRAELVNETEADVITIVRLEVILLA